MGPLRALRGMMPLKKTKIDVQSTDDTSSFVTVGSTLSGKTHWKKKDLPSERYVQIKPAVRVGESIKHVEEVLERESAVQWLAELATQCHECRKDTLMKHGQDFDPTPWSVESMRWALTEAREMTRGEFCQIGLTEPHRYEQAMFGFNAMCGNSELRDVEDCVRSIKNFLVTEHEWPSNDEYPPDDIVASLHFGDWSMGVESVPVTYDGDGEKYVWTPYTPPPAGTDESDHIISPSRRWVFQSASGSRAPADSRMRSRHPIQATFDRIAERSIIRTNAANKGKRKQTAPDDLTSVDEGVTTTRDFAVPGGAASGYAGPSFTGAS